MSALVVKWRTPGVIAAAVRDGAGIHDVRWARTTGWSCTCTEGAHCAHVAAVRSSTECEPSLIPGSDGAAAALPA